MSGHAPSRRAVLAGALAAAAAGAGAAVPAGRALVVSDASTGERLLAVPVSAGDRVTLAYTHSVEKTPVRDVYAVRGTRLEMVRMEFASYGAGLPAHADVRRTGDGSFVFDPPGVYERIHVQPGRVAGHELVVAGRRYDLFALSGGDAVTLSVARRSLLAAAADALRGAPGGDSADGTAASESRTDGPLGNPDDARVAPANDSPGRRRR